MSIGQLVSGLQWASGKGVTLTFQDWLGGEIRKSGLNYSEIARKGGISHSRISQVMGGDPPGTVFCIGVARGLNLSPDLVLEKAGIIPATHPAQERPAVRFAREIEQLPLEDQKLVFDLMERLRRLRAAPKAPDDTLATD